VLLSGVIGLLPAGVRPGFGVSPAGAEPLGDGVADRGVHLGVVGLVGHGAASPIEGDATPADRNAVAARSRISRATSNWRPGNVRAMRRS
jgi:hypothetical protein